MSGSRIEISSVGPGQVRLLALVIPAMLQDGLDLKLISYAAPLILAQWHIGKAAFAPALAAAVIGMAFGSALGGWLGDRLGRRRLIVASTLGFAGATVAAAFCRDIPSMTALRFLSGLGFGALMPNVYAIATEWLPKRAGDRAMSLLTVATPLGGAIGAPLVLWTFPLYGWEGSFVLFGLIGVVNAALMFFWLPESANFLLARDDRAGAEKAWRRIMGPAPMTLLASRSAAQDPSRSSPALFSGALAPVLLGACLTCFCCQFVNYAVGSWMPVIATMAGLSLQDAITATFSYNSFAIASGILLINMSARLGLKRILIGTTLAAILALLALCQMLQMGISPGSLAERMSFFLLVGLVGATSGGLVALLAAIVTAAYPADRRASAAGLTVMSGRLGGIITIFTGGILLDLSPKDPAPLFYTLAGFLLVSLFGSRLLGRHATAAS